jgi:hypothetical protein
MSKMAWANFELLYIILENMKRLTIPLSMWKADSQLLLFDFVGESMALNFSL